ADNQPAAIPRDLDHLQQQLSCATRWTPLRQARECYREVRRGVRERRWVPALVASVTALPKVLAVREPVVTRELLNRLSPPRALRITYVLHNLTVAGGVISVV